MGIKTKGLPQLTRRDIFRLSGAAALVGMTGLPSFAQAAGGILKVVAPSNPSSLDPATGGSGWDHSFLWTMFDTLVDWDGASMLPRPGLADWSFTDPTTLVLSVFPGITFHDGTALDGEAVAYNLRRNRDDERSNVKADLANVSEITVTGPQEVTLKLESPDSALPAILSDRAGMMVSPASVEKFGAETNRNPVGCGPWKFVSWTDADKVVVTRNENYRREGYPLVDGIEMFIIPETATGLRSVSSGSNDLVYQVPARMKPVLDRSKDLKQVVAPTLACIQLYLHYGRAPFDNVLVRQALNYAIDRKAFVAAAFAGVAEPAAMALPTSHWAYDASLADLYPYDPERARALLAEAGHADGLEIHIGGYNDQDQVLRSEILQAQFEKAGFKPRFTRGTLAEIGNQYFGAEKKFDALLSLWTGRPDPSMTYSGIFAEGSFYNAGRGATPELMDLLAASRNVSEIEARKEAFAKLQRHVMEQALFVPLAMQYELTALGPRADGYQPNLLGKPRFDEIRMV